MSQFNIGALLAVCLTLCLFSGVVSSHAAAIEPSPPDWPQFRGPSGDGHATSAVLPVEWSRDQNITWRTEIPGQGWSSPVVGGDRIYLTTAVPIKEGPTSDQSLRTICLDKQSGAIVWDVEVFRQDGATAPEIHSKNSHASPTPVVDADKVFVHFGHMGTACLNAGNGELIWSTQEYSYEPQHGNGGSPIVTGDLLIFNIDGVDKQSVVALDKTNGKLVWQTKREAKGDFHRFSFSTPLIINVNGQEQLVSAGSGVVMALDPRNGQEIWRVTYDGGFSIVPKPLFVDGLLYVCTGYTRANLIAIRTDGQGDVTDSHLAFTANRNVPFNPSLLAVDDAIYMVSDNGILTCLDAKSGAVRWRERIGGNFSASPLLANGLVYLIAEDGMTTVFRPGESYQEVAKNALEERALASFGVDGNALLLRTEKALYRIEARP